jgi:hypothetical protein
MHRFFVIEARRLLPLLFLLVLLVSLSIYDNFFREHPVLAPEEELKNVVTFISAVRGELSAPPSFEVIETREQWAVLQQEQQGLPDYPFNALYEFAVSAVNSEIKSIQVFPQEDGFSQVQVRVTAKPRFYHVVTVERDKVGVNTRWLFLDEADRILHEVVLPPPEPEPDK